jgi:peptide/nickel transport system permease protein
VVIALPGLIAPQNPLTLNLSKTLAAPSPQNLFGTDEAGRDLWSR